MRAIRKGFKTLDGVDGSEAGSQRAQLWAWYGAIRQAQGRHREAITACERAIEQARVLPRVERQSGQPAKRRRDRQRQLSPGPKSGVRGNGVRDDEPFSGVEAKAVGDAARDMGAPLALLAQNFKARRFAKLNASFERVDGEANRSKSAAKISSEIKKTEMQPR